MRKLNELFRLKFDHGLSNRKVALACNTHHSVVSDYLVRFNLAGLKWPLEPEVSEEYLYQKLFPEKQELEISPSKPIPDWEKVYEELKSHKYLTLQLIWKEYKERCPKGYGYSQFCNRFRQWKKTLDVTFRQNYRGGDRMFVDYAGGTVKIKSPLTGQHHDAFIFVAVLAASNYTFAEAHTNQDVKNWIGGHVRAFNYFQGVPQTATPDNLKAGVQSPCFYDPTINPTYNDMAMYYNLVVLPARKRKPKDKAKVEAGVKVVGQQILAVLRNRAFFSIQELNQAIKELLEELNNREMKHLEKSRKQMFESLDKPNLQPLPQKAYEFAEWKKVKVGIDYHVGYDKNFYSVPYRFAHKQAEVRATEKGIEVFHKHVRIASHPRWYEKNQYITIKEHMPANHQFMVDWNPKRFIRWAQKIGPSTTELIKQVLDTREHPQQSFRKCLGILNLAKRYSDERLEAAAQRALHYKIFSYKKIKNILDKGYEKINSGKNSNRESQPSLFHNNIRGDRYYGKSEPKIDSQASMSFSSLVQVLKERHEDGTN
jgi:transposase